MAAYFDTPSGMNAEKLLANLGKKFDIRQESQQYTLKTYYDSFDWRLWRQGLICEFTRTQTSSMLNLIDRKENRVIHSIALFDVPVFAHQLNPGKVRNSLEEILDVRALLTIGTVECDVSHFDVYDAKGQVQLRLILEEFALLRNSLHLLAYKSDGKFAQTVEAFLHEELGFTYRKKPALVELLQLQGRQPKDYSAKITLNLNRDADAHTACKTVLLNLLNVIKLNEQGVIADTDIEFLHDFRVAVRKTRVGLKQFELLLPAASLAPHLAFFIWLGQITSETRDMDVYLLNLEPYQKQLPKNLRAGLLPLQAFLQNQKARSHKQLAQKLRSKKYKTGIDKWQNYLTLCAEDTKPVDQPIELKTFASQKIWKLFKQVLNQSASCSPNSAPEVLHNLRKTCKKLRYLLEFFQDIYPEHKIKSTLNHLKDLQLVLGEYQDLFVQQNHLQHFLAETHPQLSNETHAAIDILIEKLERRQVKAHEKCTAGLAKFNKLKNRKLFKELFKSGE